MGYCFVTTQKVKTLGALGAKYNHNYRKVRVENADPDQIHRNEELLSLPVQDGRQMSYVDFFHKRFSELITIYPLSSDPSFALTKISFWHSASEYSLNFAPASSLS